MKWKKKEGEAKWTKNKRKNTQQQGNSQAKLFNNWSCSVFWYQHPPPPPQKKIYNNTLESYVPVWKRERYPEKGEKYTYWNCSYIPDHTWYSYREKSHCLQWTRVSYSVNTCFYYFFPIRIFIYQFFYRYFFFRYVSFLSIKSRSSAQTSVPLFADVFVPPCLQWHAHTPSCLQ